MSTETLQQDPQNVDEVAASPTSGALLNERRRPRLNTAALGLGGDGERKRGKSMFGVLVNTLNKAKAENKERNASEAAKKRQLIDQRLQSKLKKEIDVGRQKDDAKKDRIAADRKEEEWQMKDSMYKLRRSRVPLLSHFLSTSDAIRDNDDDEMETNEGLNISSLLPPRTHPAPLYYLPVKLLPVQETFLSRRKEKAFLAVEKEWEDFKEQRKVAVDEISELRRKGAEAQTAADAQLRDDGEDTANNTNASRSKEGSRDVDMDVDDASKNGVPKKALESEKTSVVPSNADDEDDAVEY